MVKFLIFSEKFYFVDMNAKERCTVGHLHVIIIYYAPEDTSLVEHFDSTLSF